MRILIVGIGSMGKNHLRVLATFPDVEIITVDPYSVDANFTQVSRALDTKIDAAIISTPTESHFEIALDLGAKGIPTLLEKPGTAKLSDYQTLAEKFKLSQTPLYVGYVERFNPAVDFIMQTVQNQELGKLQRVDFLRLGPPDGRIKKHGVHFDLASHDLDLAQYAFGIPLKGLTITDTKFDETKRLRFIDLALKAEKFSVHMRASDDYPMKVRRVEIWGDKGLLQVDLVTQSIEHTFSANAYNLENELELTRMPPLESRKLFLKIQQPLKSEIDEFINSVVMKINSQKLASPGDALETHRALEEINNQLFIRSASAS